MTSTPSVRADTETEQAHGPLLGEYKYSRAVRLTLHDRGDYAVILRHRFSADVDADVVAHVDHAGGVVSGIEWDRGHGVARPEWMGDAEAWVRARITAAHAGGS